MRGTINISLMFIKNNNYNMAYTYPKVNTCHIFVISQQIHPTICQQSQLIPMLQGHCFDC